MRLTKKRRRRKKIYLEFIVMMVFCFMVGYCIRFLLEECPIILWVGIGIFGSYVLLLLIAMAILINQKKQEIKHKLELLDNVDYDKDFDEEDFDIDDFDWVLEAFEIGQRVFRKIINCFIVVGGIFFACFIIIQVLPKAEPGVSLSGKDLDEIVLQNHAKLLEENEVLQQNLKKAYYQNASEEERLKVLTGVVVTESSYLGIEAPTLRINELADNLGGYYTPKTHEIVVNKNNISEEEKVLNTLLHEMYHAYQYTCVKQLDLTGDLLWAKKVAQWKEEFESKGLDLNTNDGMIEYYTQSIEEEARQYAEQRLEVYLYYMEN